MTTIKFSWTIYGAVCALAIVTAVGLSGCCTARLYDGPPLSRREVGVLSMPNQLMPNRNRVIVVSIDGQNDPEWSGRETLYTTFELKPGRHTVVLECQRLEGGSGTGFSDYKLHGGTQTVTLDVQPGRLYRFNWHLRYTYEEPNGKVWWESLIVQDMTTKTTVFETRVQK
jgi:hypothetical protein